MKKHIRSTIRFAMTTTLFTLTGLAVSSAYAVNYAFQGTFKFDNDVPVINFNVAVDSEITIVTRGYGGGTLSNGTNVAPGGFDPLIHVWRTDGTRLAFNDDSFTIAVQDDPDTGQGYDSGLQFPIVAGDYQLTIAQVGNQPADTNLAAGYSRDSNPNFTRDLFAPPGSDGYFYDVLGNHRNGHWAVDLLNINLAALASLIDNTDTDDSPDVTINPGPDDPVSSPIPEPLSATLAAAGLCSIGMVLGRRRR